MKVAALIPSAGSGRRMRSRIGKPFLKIGGDEIILYTLRALENNPLISEIIIAAKTRDIPRVKRLISKHRFTKIKNVVKGGKRRSASVFNALCSASPDTDLVLIHDVARPFISQALIKRCIRAAERYGASVASVLVKPTIKEAEPKRLFVNKTLERHGLWEAQTPQVVKRSLLLEAYKKAGKRAGECTDDTSLVEMVGKRVRIVRGDYDNIKITTPEDMIMANTILGRRKTRCRIG